MLTVRLYDDAYREWGVLAYVRRGSYEKVPAYRAEEGVKIAEILRTYFMNGPSPESEK